MIVRDVVKIIDKKDLQIVAGEAGLEKKISSVTVLEVTEPEGQNWLIEDQLYITSLFSVRNDAEKQIDIVKTLITANSAGLIICHLGYWLQKIDYRLIELCNLYGFPLLVAESNMTYVELLNPILLQLMENPSENNVDTGEMQRKLIEYVVNKRDIKIIYKTMTDYYRNKIWFIDIHDHVIHPREEGDSAFITNLFKQGITIKKLDKITDLVCYADTIYLVRLVYAESSFYGRLIAQTTNEKITDDNKVLETLSNIFALITSKKSGVKEFEQRKVQEYLGDLITWNFRSDTVAFAIGKEIGWNIENVNQCVIININTYQEKTGGYLRDFEKYIETVQFAKIRSVILKENKNNLIGIRSDLIIVFLSEESNDENRIDVIFAKILKTWDSSLSGNFSAGVSSIFKSPEKIPDAYKEATIAVRFARRFLGENSLAKFSGLGIYKIVEDLKQDKDLITSIEQSYYKLVEHDKVNNQDLIATLRCLILNNMNVNRVADVMFLHKNTVNYRKNRINEILGYKPWEMPYLLNSIVFSMLE